jgi:hypothetical protein
VGALTGSTQTCGAAGNAGGGTSIVPITDCANQASVLGTLDGNCPSAVDVPSTPDDPSNPSEPTNATDAPSSPESVSALTDSALDASLPFTGATIGNALALGLVALLIGSVVLGVSRGGRATENGLID